jgi:transcriptional regulator with XRE-family HTH domain
MNTRLKQFLAAENITQAQFADTINVVRASVSHILAGRNNPGYDFIKALMQHYPNLNMEWLILGKGKMYKGTDEGQLFFNISDDLPSESAEIVEDPVLSLDLPTDDIPSLSVEKTAEVAVPASNQRKVSKIIVLFDDGTYQEM